MKNSICQIFYKANEFLDLLQKMESFPWYNAINVLEYIISANIFFYSLGLTRELRKHENNFQMYEMDSQKQGNPCATNWEN